jgi:alanine-synthesizing transaminase
VLVPRPSYPLLEHLTRLEGVEPIPYPLEYHGRWEIDLAAVAARATPRTRAVLVVNPNNPTGSFVTAAEWDGVTALCRERGFALIVDEVFGRYPIVVEPRGPSVLDRPSDVLTFVLGGLSKAVGLPQLKLGWVVMAGPDDDVTRAREGLEFIADMYLPVGTPVQRALSSLLDAGGAVTAQIAARIRTNHAALRAVVERHPAAQMLRVDGGWYAVVQVPAIRTEERLVLDLLERERVLVHPGYFFDFPREAFVVLSLLPEPTLFADAAVRVVARATVNPDT